jgi:ribonucleoside-diphosphate reductase alpha chain
MESHIVDGALKCLGYAEEARVPLLKYLERHKTLEGSSLRTEDLPVFDCSIGGKGKRVLDLSAHLKMTATLQPYISGAISKTMNAPNSVTQEQIGRAFFEAWSSGIKSITVYRDGCKKSQPIQTDAQKAQATQAARAVRRKLSDHQMNMHRIKIKFGNVKGYVLATPYEDTGLPGELFVKLAKEGSTISGLVDGWAQAVSYCLQFGVPLETLVEKFSGTKFEPSGFSPDADIRHASSIYDAVMRKLSAVFLDGVNGNGKTAEEMKEIEKASTAAPPTIDAPMCTTCGNFMTPIGASCHHCPSCGISDGCG